MTDTTNTAPMILPGIHPGLTREQYDAIDAVNQSRLKKLIGSTPLHYRYAIEHPEPPSDAQAFGDAVHRACYEPARFAETVVAMPDFNRRTNAGKAEYEAFCAENIGKVIVPHEEYEQIRCIQAAVMAHKSAGRLIAYPGHRECSVVWRDKGTELNCKARMDHLMSNGGSVLDLKTTRCAHPAAFSADIRKYGYDVQGSFYCDGVAAVSGEEPPAFTIIAVEKDPPYGVAVYELDPTAMALGRKLYTEAMELLARCIKRDEWPGYSEHIEPISVPVWALRAHNIETLEAA